MQSLARSGAIAVVALVGGWSLGSLELAADSRIGVTPQPSTIGDPENGRALISEIGCGSCHIIPGINGADGLVGPPLNLMARRQYLAGLLRNTPGNMITWLRFPQHVVPGNAMPNMGLTEVEAGDIAAYLYTLR